MGSTKQPCQDIATNESMPKNGQVLSKRVRIIPSQLEWKGIGRNNIKNNRKVVNIFSCTSFERGVLLRCGNNLCDYELAYI